MGLARLQSLQNLHLLVAHSPSSSTKPVYPRSSSVPSFRNLSNLSFSCSLGRPSTLFGSCGNHRSYGLKRSCRARSKEFFDDGHPVEDFGSKFDVSGDKGKKYNDTASSAVSEISKNSKRQDGEKTRERTDHSMSFLPKFLEPNFIGIQPELTEWPERDEILKMSIARKANSVQIPLSLRMIGRKQKCEEGSVDSGDVAHCSAKKAFSSMVFMIRELQNHALSTRGSLYSEDFQEILDKYQKEMNGSFVWLFQQVFSRTPDLMVYVMLLLANFTVHSMVDNLATNPSRRFNHNLISTKEVSREQINGKRSSTLLPGISFPGHEEMIGEEEMEMWKLVVEEASTMQEATYPVLDQETKKQLISSILVEIEPEDYMEFHGTDLVYQMGVSDDPNNPLLLSNYAQFLYVVRHDYDRAEECFKRAIMSGPEDPETLSRYADFLWVVRKDLWSAEELYQQAIEAAPDNHHYASKYANFLWSTGGEDTCFPLSS